MPTHTNADAPGSNPGAPIQGTAASAEIQPEAPDASRTKGHLVLAESSAEFSSCGRYRYALRRTFDVGPTVLFVGLNPSTADAHADDPTIRRCLGFARRWGYGTLVMANLYALRSTDPRGLWDDDWPVGEPTEDGGTVNDDRLFQLAREADLTVAAWGADHGPDANRSAYVLGLLGDCVALALTKHGRPRHPLYVRGDVEPVPFHEASGSVEGNLLRPIPRERARKEARS